jgi:hypothetical protein
MPWNETEKLFKSTLEAAIVATPHVGVTKNLKVIDLGEAGRQEVWQSGSKCLQKTIAKHGGKQTPTSESCVSAIVPNSFQTHQHVECLVL